MLNSNILCDQNAWLTSGFFLQAESNLPFFRVCAFPVHAELTKKTCNYFRATFAALPSVKAACPLVQRAAILEGVDSLTLQATAPDFLPLANRLPRAWHGTAAQLGLLISLQFDEGAVEV